MGKYNEMMHKVLKISFFSKFYKNLIGLWIVDCVEMFNFDKMVNLMYKILLKSKKINDDKVFNKFLLRSFSTNAI